MKNLALTLLATLLLAGSAGTARAADYLAYAVTKDGEAALPENLDDLAHKRAKDLVLFRWGDYDGPKSRVAVLPLENKTAVNSVTISGPNGQTYGYSITNIDGSVPVDGIDAMIGDVLLQTGRFAIVERKALGELLELTRDHQYAENRVRHYQEQVRRDSGASHRREKDEQN